MKIWLGMVLFVALLHNVVCDVPPSPSVIRLTGATFDEHVYDSAYSDDQVWLVKFFAPWCGHCQAMAKPFEAAAQLFHADVESKISVGGVNCDEEGLLCEHFSVKAYPTIYVLKPQSGLMWKFKSSNQFSRTTENFVSFAQFTASRENMGEAIEMPQRFARGNSQLDIFFERLAVPFERIFWRHRAAFFALVVLCGIGTGLLCVFVIVSRGRHRRQISDPITGGALKKAF